MGIAVFLFPTCLTSPAHSAEPVHFQTETVEIVVETLASGLDHPWAVEPLDGDTMLITERSGALRVFKNGKLSKPVKGLPKLYADVQGGLLDVAVSPSFATDHLLFFTATQPFNHGIGVIVFKAKLAGDGGWLADTKTIFHSSKPNIVDHNFGSRIAIADDGSLFVTIGDQAREALAQDPFDHRGSVIHINRDGSIPDNNPFRDGVGGLPEIWSIGHRNPQGIAFDPRDSRLYTVEHGPKGGDELNAPEPGKNYGWPVISYGSDYNGGHIGSGTAAPGMEQPVYYWDPSIAPSSLLVYHGDMFPEWEGNFLVTALKFELIARLARDADGNIVSEERFLEGEFGRLRDIKQAPDGSLLVVTDEDDGQLLRISRAPST
ncbi:PQQ-dependent sugar dehydrogenase [Rhizobium sp. KVB221]|uniref:PQQ-dependent sugar dehydrogenase n=2 Tax=Rhizobium setariae TaxID=2801340 RepID=A0A936YPP3_9HYPH|nr:PQQ-dependent sugar dehydrogenase [Rhizobium setariae]MBL0371944.1 PQQ-dependent sugar dehydrogenase [Rhizobium setariae]